MAKLWLETRAAAVAWGVSGLCSPSHRRGQKKTWRVLQQHSHCAAGTSAATSATAQTGCPVINPSGESFSRWYCTVCTRRAGIQRDFSGESSFRHGKPIAYCNEDFRPWLVSNSGLCFSLHNLLTKMSWKCMRTFSISFQNLTNFIPGNIFPYNFLHSWI